MARTEAELIERIRRAFSTRQSRAAGLRVGIGDDAALLEPPAGTQWAISTDAFLENVHFLNRLHSPEDSGYRALARATSDLAAMGAAPRFFFLTLALPGSRTGAWLDRFLKGMALAARRFGMVLAGGDTSRYPVVIASLTVLGETLPGRALLRSGARPGDRIYVSGTLGASALGLELLRRGIGQRAGCGPLLRRHLRPEIRLWLGQRLAEERIASAAIDLSDGLSTDLAHLCAASGGGARIEQSKLPLVHIPGSLARLGLDLLRLALHGGEDYELLFTVPPKIARKLRFGETGWPITQIGAITSGRRILMEGKTGQARVLAPGGWDPFR